MDRHHKTSRSNRPTSKSRNNYEAPSKRWNEDYAEHRAAKEQSSSRRGDANSSIGHQKEMGRTRWSIVDEDNFREEKHHQSPTLSRNRESFPRQPELLHPRFRERSRSPLNDRRSELAIRDDFYENRRLASPEMFHHRDLSRSRDSVFDRISQPSRNGRNSESRNFRHSSSPLSPSKFLKAESPERKFFKKSPSNHRNLEAPFRNTSSGRQHSLSHEIKPEPVRTRNYVDETPVNDNRRRLQQSDEMPNDYHHHQQQQQQLEGTSGQRFAFKTEYQPDRMNGYELTIKDLRDRISAAQTHIQGVSQTVQRYEREINKLRQIVHELVDATELLSRPRALNHQ